MVQESVNSLNLFANSKRKQSTDDNKVDSWGRGQSKQRNGAQADKGLNQKILTKNPRTKIVEDMSRFRKLMNTGRICI